MFSRMAAVLYQRVRGFLWFSRAASGMYAPGHGKVSIPLPGLDHSSQRAEIAALLLAVKTFRGPIHFFSDCTIAVKGFLILYKGNRLFKLQPSILGQFYLWQEIANFCKERVSVVHISKLAAHGRNPHQDPYLTAGYCGYSNRLADEAARSCAADLFRTFAEHFLPAIQQAVSLQSHLIRFFVEQVGFSPLCEDESMERTDVFSSSSISTPVNLGRVGCTCVPSTRFSKKGRVTCADSCPFALSVRSNVSVEKCFLNLVDKREWIPERVWLLIQGIDILTGEEDVLNLAISPMSNWTDKVGISQRIPGDSLFRVSMSLPGVVEPECLDTLLGPFSSCHCPI